MTRLRGHLTVVAGGVHDGRQDGPVYAGVQAADGGVGPVRADCGIAVSTQNEAAYFAARGVADGAPWIPSREKDGGPWDAACILRATSGMRPA